MPPDNTYDPAYLFAAADHMRHVARLTQQVAAALATYLDYYVAMPNQEQSSSNDGHSEEEY